MSFPQTTPVNAVRAGQEYWRLFTPLESSGDVYRSDVSALAFALGPQSDLTAVNITYFDPSSPSRSNVVTITKDKPMIGRLDALASEQYGTGQQARLLISPADLIPQNGVYEPTGFAAPDALVIEPSFIDLYQYFPQEPSIIPSRADRIFFYQAPTLPLASNGIWYVIPYYGRKYASMMFGNASGVTYTYSVFGVTLNTGAGLWNDPQITLRGPAVVVATGTTINEEITAETDGMYDLLVVHLDTAVPTGSPLALIALKLRVSDQVG